jgi:hypothetical protein
MQKLYCYVDESGQDPKSEFFVVVAVVSVGNPEDLRNRLVAVEQLAGTNRKKWHKVRHSNKMRYLTLVLEQKIATGEVYAAHFKKPIPYFFPMIEVLEKAIKEMAQRNYSARIHVDGIDKQKSQALTNALRASGISLRMVRSRRDESEPLIRLADMWAGCHRSALLKDKDAQAIFRRAKKEKYLRDLTT